MSHKYYNGVSNLAENRWYTQPKVENRSHLPAGCYTVNYDHGRHEIFFKNLETNHDSLIDIPSPEYQEITKRMQTFLKPETKKLFVDNGFLYKQSFFLYGKPGTGKTCIVNRVISDVVKEGGIVLFPEDVNWLMLALPFLKDIETPLTMIVLEELDQLVAFREGSLLNLLDGEVQMNNVIFSATTNFIDSIPPRIYRPSRFSTTIEVQFPNEECRAFYLQHKMPDISADLLNKWIKSTDGFSIDELKETVLTYLCFGDPLEKSINKIKELKKLSSGEINPSEYHDIRRKKQRAETLSENLQKAPEQEIYLD